MKHYTLIKVAQKQRLWIRACLLVRSKRHDVASRRVTALLIHLKREEGGGGREEGVRQPFAATVNYVLMPAIFHAPDERTAGRILRLASVVSSHQGRRKRRGKRDKLLEKTSSFSSPSPSPPPPRELALGVWRFSKLAEQMDGSR